MNFVNKTSCAQSYVNTKISVIIAVFNAIIKINHDAIFSPFQLEKMLTMSSTTEANHIESNPIQLDFIKCMLGAKFTSLTYKLSFQCDQLGV